VHSGDAGTREVLPRDIVRHGEQGAEKGGFPDAHLMGVDSLQQEEQVLQALEDLVEILRNGLGTAG